MIACHKLLGLIAASLMATVGPVVVPIPAFAHGGGLNAQGCHHDRKNGGYHCHRAPKQVGDAQKSAATPEPQPAPAAPPKCYVGPRGGTYTITPSGSKNYKGC